MLTRPLPTLVLPVAAALTVLWSVLPADAQGRRGQRPSDTAAESASQAPAPKKEDKTFPQNVTWTVAGAQSPESRPAFILDQNFRMKGFGGCNNFSATAYPLQQQGLAVGPIALTKKSCDKGVMAAEHSFLTTLRGAQKWDLEAGALVIKSGSGTLRFERTL